MVVPDPRLEVGRLAPLDIVDKEGDGLELLLGMAD